MTIEATTKRPTISLFDMEEILRELVPDFRGIVLYPINASSLPEHLRPADDTFACTGENLDLALRGWLEDSGRWQGRGIVIILNDLAIARYTAAIFDFRGDADFAGEMFVIREIGSLLHEAAHAFELIGQPEVEPTPSQTAGMVEQFAAFCVSAAPIDPVDFEDHDGKFIRRLCHMAERCERLIGQRVPLNLCLDSRRFGLSPLDAYYAALADEIAEYPKCPFARLERLRPPQPFIDLWRDDLTRLLEQAKTAAARLPAIADGLQLWGNE